MPILRLTLLPCRFAIITIVAALALAQAPAAGAANIFVAKLNFSTSSESLREAFEQFGAVSSAKVITDSATGRSKGYGFVEMPDDQEARAAIVALDGSDLDGHTIVVKRAEPRESADAGTARPGGLGGGGGARPAGGFGGGGVRPAGGLDPSPKPATPTPTPTSAPPPTPTPTVADVPAAGDAAADETSSSEALDDAEVGAELDALDTDADAADEAMEDGEAELDASEDFTGEEEESDSDGSMEVDAADSDESAEVDDAQVDESLDAADETDGSDDERA